MELKQYLVDVAVIYRVAVYAYTEDAAATYAKAVEPGHGSREQRIHHMRCLGPADGQGAEGETLLCNDRDDAS